MNKRYRNTAKLQVQKFFPKTGFLKNDDIALQKKSSGV